AVFLSREKNAALLDQTNREGLVDGKAFAHLRTFAEETVRFFELNHQDFEMSRAPKKAQRETAKTQATEALKNLSDAADVLASLVRPPGDPLSIAPPSAPTALLAGVQQALANAQEQLEESSKVFRAEDERESREKDTMANLASLGILAAAFGHETLGWA